MPDRNLNDVHPDLKPLIQKLIEAAEAQNIHVEPIFTFRTPAEQDALYAQGRTTPGKIVTSLQGTASKHCFTVSGVPAAKAVDLGVFNDDGSYVGYGDDPRYIVLGHLWQAMAGQYPTLGLIWGGSWTSPHDPDHFQIA